MKLSICVITMNRANQLREALESCLACELPDGTEFVIIDNASTDDTESTVHTLLQNCGYKYYYEKLEENLGAGGGRNYAYDKASGEYVYMLDDDAVIDFEKNPDFFIRAIDIMENNSNIVTLTTQIYDTAWKKDRLNGKVRMSEGLYKYFMFCEGSHFIRKSFYLTSPYVPNKYGYEALLPSLIAMDSGKINVFYSDLLAIHNPAVDKWNWNDEKNHELLIKGIALPYAIKKMMYPVIFFPFLYLANELRIKIYLKPVKNARVRAKKTAVDFCRDYPIDKKIKVSTVVRMFCDFKLSVF